MLSVTDAAVKELSDILDQTNASSDQCIRLVQNEDALALQMGEQRAGDQVISGEERPVLLIDSDLSQALEGATLDAVETDEGKQLMLVGTEPGDRGEGSPNGAW